MDVRFWAQTDVGRQREHNEDSFLIDKRLRLFICCDGMGGHAAGEVASAAAVHEVRKFLAENRDIVEKYADDHAMVDRRDVLTLMEHAVHHACSRVHQLAQLDVRRKGMGTTLVAMLVCGNRGFIAHVGDSRVYLLRQQQIHQLTEDHSLVNELIRRGKLKQGQEVALPYRNAVTRAVGVYPSVEVDTLDFDLLPSDRYLLCSDGLSGYLDATPEAFQPLFAAKDLKGIPQHFIEFANGEGGKDNITAVIIEVTDDTPQEDQAATQEVQLKLDTLGGTPLFKYLTYKERVKLLNITTTAEYAAGSVIMTEGEEGDSFFVTLEGRIEVTKTGTTVVILEKGSHFGEMAMVDRAPRSATLKALSPTRLLCVSRDSFYGLLRKDPQLAVKLLWAFVQVLTIRLRRSTSELAAQRTELELIEQMEPLFKAVSEPSIPRNIMLQSTDEVGLEHVEALGADEVDRLAENEDVLATETTFQALRLATKRRPPPVPSPVHAASAGGDAEIRATTPPPSARPPSDSDG